MVEASQISGYEGTKGRVKMTVQSQWYGQRVGAAGGWCGSGRGWFLATEWVQLKYDYIGPKTSNQIPVEPPNMLALCFSHLCILICYFFSTWQQPEV